MPPSSPDLEPRRPGLLGLAGRIVLLVGGFTALTALSGGKAGERLSGKIRTRSQKGTSGEIGRGFHGTPASMAARGEGHETEDMSGALMGKLFLGLGFTVACVIGLMIWYVAALSPTQNGPPLTAQQTVPIEPPKPNLQAEPLDEINALRHREEIELDTYAWVDADHTRARIPISRAKTLVLGHSLDTAP